MPVHNSNRTKMSADQHKWLNDLTINIHKNKIHKDKLLAFTRNPYIWDLWEVKINNFKVLLLEMNNIFIFYFVDRGTDSHKHISDYCRDTVYSLRQFLTIHCPRIRCLRANKRDIKWNKKQYQHLVNSR